LAIGISQGLRCVKVKGSDLSRRTKIRVLVIIPALNEAATLPAVLDSLHAAVPEYAVVVVDDGSTDGTADVARAHGSAVLVLPFNLGIGGALRTGFRYAVQQDFDAAVQLDADGQHDPTMIPKLIAALDGADFVVGSRFASKNSYEVGLTRRKAMQLLEFSMRVLSGRTFTDTSSGFRAFGRPVLEYFARSYPSEYMESVEALLAANYAGFRIAEVPVQMHQRAGGTPSAMRFKLIYHYVRVMFTMFTRASRRRAPAPDSSTVEARAAKLSEGGQSA
jgi:glycosyltransferase involved in cell wall biosynthesis